MPVHRADNLVEQAAARVARQRRGGDNHGEKLRQRRRAANGVQRRRRSRRLGAVSRGVGGSAVTVGAAAAVAVRLEQRGRPLRLCEEPSRLRRFGFSTTIGLPIFATGVFHKLAKSTVSLPTKIWGMYKKYEEPKTTNPTGLAPIVP